MTGYIYTVLKKADGFGSPLTKHLDWCEYGVSVKEAKGFMPGGSIMLRSNERR
jgi:hypothetical protein